MQRAPSNRVSPSQIGTWDSLCKRRWWFSRHRPRGHNVYAEFGDETHQVLEDWLTYGKPPDLRTKQGLCAVQGLDLIPSPGVPLVEHKFTFTFEGIAYNGRIDFIADYVQGRTITIGDHKTIGKIARAKTPEQLLDDPQRVIYSAYATRMFGVAEVRASWVYYQRTRPRAKRVDLIEDRDTIERRFVALHRRVGLPILAAKHIETPHAFPRNLASCHLFPPHGCPYAAECLQGVSGLELAAAALDRACT